jgi:hypothetical protein
MNKDLPTPKEGAVFYEDKDCYVTLANYPFYFLLSQIFVYNPF